ncbi:MAG: type II secretion system F family protein [Gammaproteobacteria bacterium]|nr:type II secretion system F family protein [Gammaproteobacteria bacterium]
MPIFQYKATNAEGEVLEGELDAAGEDAVIRRLQSQGHIPIRVRLLEATMVTPKAKRSRSNRITETSVNVFTLELSTLLQAGLPLERALGVLTQLADSDALQEVTESLHTEVRRGADLSAAMEQHESVFSRFYINLVRAGEASGALEYAMERLGDFMERSRELRQQFNSAMLYPLILVGVAMISIGVVMGVVVPKFATMFEDAGAALPVPTQIVLAASNFLQSYWWVLVIVGVAGYFLAKERLRDPAVQLAKDRLLLRLPVIGDLVSKLEAARFSRTLGTLLANDVPLLDALAIARESISNRVVAGSINDVARSVRQGAGLAKPLLAAGTFPKLAGHLLQVGEETGELQSMLMKLAEIYDREVGSALKRVVTLVEPIIIVFLALFIGGIILSIVVAILGVNELAL